MTKIQNPIIGRAKGSAGNMTFCKNYDKNIMRSKPMEVSNPKTAAQTNQRNYFGMLTALVMAFSAEQLTFLFPKKPKAMSRRNALSKQLAEDVTVRNGQKVIDFANIDTLGNASTMDFGTTTCTNVGDTINVTLDAAVKANTELGDNYFVVALVNETLGEITMPINSAKVSVGTLAIAAPSGWLVAHTIHAIPLVTGSKIVLTGYGTMSVTKRPAR